MSQKKIHIYVIKLDELKWNILYSELNANNKNEAKANILWGKARKLLQYFSSLYEIFCYVHFYYFH